MRHAKFTSLHLAYADLLRSLSKETPPRVSATGGVFRHFESDSDRLVVVPDQWLGFDDRVDFGENGAHFGFAVAAFADHNQVRRVG